jgi:hypothetical protein
VGPKAEQLSRLQEIWVKGTVFGHRICKNQVLQRLAE